jgi:hypothetical protein
LKKWCLVSLVWVCGVAGAQTSSTKSDLVAKVLTLQQTAIEQTAQALVERPALQMMQQAGAALQTQVGALLDQRFSEDELKQLIAIIESPVNRKFLQMGGELQKALADKLIAETQAAVEPKVKALEQAMVKHLGLPATPAAKAEPASKAAKK